MYATIAATNSTLLAAEALQAEVRRGGRVLPEVWAAARRQKRAHGRLRPPCTLPHASRASPPRLPAVVPKQGATFACGFEGLGLAALIQGAALKGCQAGSGVKEAAKRAQAHQRRHQPRAVRPR